MQVSREIYNTITSFLDDLIILPSDWIYNIFRSLREAIDIPKEEAYALWQLTMERYRREVWLCK